VSPAFVDSSAVVKLLLPEEESPALRRRLRGERLLASELARTEVARAIRRTGGSSPSHVARALESLDMIAIDATVLDEAARLDPASLGSLDAIQLATALSIASELDAFITYDRQLGKAAAAAGLPVEAPR
jgi:predicted nucleic acid-binding protein